MLEIDIILEENRRLKAEMASLSNQLEATESHNTELTDKLTNLLEQIKLMNQRKFASSSEANILQHSLFDECAVADSGEMPDEAQSITYQVTRTLKNKPKRSVLPENLERIDIVLDLDEEDKRCDCCGEMRHQMGEEISERLIVIPAKLQVERTSRPKYVCNHKSCQNEAILTQPLPPHILPKSNASPSRAIGLKFKQFPQKVG